MNTDNPAESLKNSVVLIVDDSALNLTGTAITIQVIGYSTDVTRSGEGALAKLKFQSYAAILMDLQMPRMSGFQCAEKSE